MRCEMEWLLNFLIYIKMLLLGVFAVGIFSVVPTLYLTILKEIDRIKMVSYITFFH